MEKVSNIERATAAGLDNLPDILGEEAANRFFSVIEAIEPYHHRDVPPEHCTFSKLRFNRERKNPFTGTNGQVFCM